MEYLIEGEDLAKIRAGVSGMMFLLAANCGGSDIYCKSDTGCGKWKNCIHPTTYAGCSGGTLTFPEVPIE